MIFAAFADDYRRANRAIGRMVAMWPDRLLGFAFVHPVADKGRVADMVPRRLTCSDLVGIKVHRTTDASRARSATPPAASAAGAVRRHG